MTDREGELLSQDGWRGKINKICSAANRSLNTIRPEHARCIKGVVGVGSLGAGPDDKNPPRVNSDFDLEVITDASISEAVQAVAVAAFLIEMETLLEEVVVLDYPEEPFTPFGSSDMSGVREICSITKDNGEHNALSIIYVAGATELLSCMRVAAMENGLRLHSYSL